MLKVRVPAHSFHITANALCWGVASLHFQLRRDTIRNWNDPAIAAINPGVSLPHQRIEVLYRGDPSGTNYIWTEFLSKVSGKWKSQVGCGITVKWPVGKFTWFLVPKNGLVPAKSAALRSFLRWMLTDGQEFAEGLGYARLPEELSRKELAIIERL